MRAIQIEVSLQSLREMINESYQKVVSLYNNGAGRDPLAQMLNTVHAGHERARYIALVEVWELFTNEPWDGPEAPHDLESHRRVDVGAAGLVIDYYIRQEKVRSIVVHRDGCIKARPEGGTTSSGSKFKRMADPYPHWFVVNGGAAICASCSPAAPFFALFPSLEDHNS